MLRNMIQSRYNISGIDFRHGKHNCGITGVFRGDFDLYHINQEFNYLNVKERNNQLVDWSTPN